jgi:hypothetical protein
MSRTQRPAGRSAQLFVLLNFRGADSRRSNWPVRSERTLPVNSLTNDKTVYAETQNVC